MEAGGHLVEQNGSHGEGCSPEPGGVEDGSESDCELTLDNLPWTPEEGEILEMCNAVDDGDNGGRGGEKDGCKELKEDPEPLSTMEIEAINRCHESGRDNRGGCGGEDGGGGVSEEFLEMRSAMKDEAVKGCHGDDSGGDGDRSGKKEAVMRKGPWTATEDALLIKAVEEFGPSDWVTIEKYSGLARTSKSCRLRWTNHLRPNLKKGAFTFEEVRRVVRLHYKYGNKWSRIAKKLPGRTDNEIKNFWHSMIKKCKKQGLPLYPDWCREEEQQTSTDDDDGGNGNGDVSDPKKLISIPVEDSSTTSLFAPVSSPEFRLASPPPPCSQGQETLQCFSDQKLLSSSSLLPQNQPYFVQQPSPSFQTAQFPPFHSGQTSLSASIQSPQTRLWTPQEQDSSVPHYFPSTHEPGLIDQSNQATRSSIEPSSQNRFPSFQNFLSPRPTPINSSTSPSMSSSSALLQLSSPQQNYGSSAQQPSFKGHLSLRKSNFMSFKPLRPPPNLSSPSGRFKRLQRLTCQLPPSKLAHLPFPKQPQSVSALEASASPFYPKTSSSVPHSSSELNTLTTESLKSPLKLNLSTKVPTLPSVQSNTSTSAPISCPEISLSTTETSISSLQLNSLTTASPHSFLRLNLSTPTLPESYVQINPSIIASSGSSPERNSSTSELPVSSVQLNSSTSPASSFIVKSEPPSIQYPRKDFKSTPEIRQNLNKAKSKICSELLDALRQKTRAEASLSDLHLVKGYLLSKQLKKKHLYGNILRTKLLQNITSNKGVLLRGSPCREGFSSGSLRTTGLLGESQTRQVIMSKRPDNQGLLGNYSYTKFPKTINFSSGNSSRDCLLNIGSNEKDLLGRSVGIGVPSNSARKQDLLRKTARKEGQLSEVSKTGVLLVEKTRKEVPVSKREGSLHLSSQREVSLSEGSMPEDLKLIERLDTEKLLGESLLRESLKRKGPTTESLEKKCSLSTSSKRDHNSREALSGKNLWSEGFLTSQGQASVQGELGHQNLLASDVFGGDLHSAEFSAVDFFDSMSESSKRICFRDENFIGDMFGESSGRKGSLAIHGQEYVSDAFGPLFSQSTATTPLRSGDSVRESTYVQSYKGGCLAESSGKEWSESLQAACIEDQTMMNHLLGETMREEGLLESQDQLHTIYESSLFHCQYASPSLIRSSHPGAELSSPQPSTAEHLDKCVKIEDSLCKSLEKGNFCDKELGNELLKESSREEPVLASIEQKPSQYGLDLVVRGSTTAYLSKSRGQSGEAGAGHYCSGDSKDLMRENSQEETELASLQEKPLQNGLDPVICQSTTAHLLESSLQSGESGSAHCSAGKKVKQELEGDHQNTMPEELSSLLEFFPTTDCEFPGLQFLEQLDMCLGLEMPLHSSPPMTTVRRNDATAGTAAE